jgi:hypothetical protein
MLNLGQVRQELEAICDNDILFLAGEDVADSSDLIGYIVRQCRKEELLSQISGRH